MLGDHPLEAGPRVPQTVGEGGRRQAQDDALQVVLSGIATEQLQLVEFSHKRIEEERIHHRIRRTHQGILTN